ncbi:MAG: hypothetical protein J0H68_00865 [Sphingobacteriia bacterium]|nr:hypothetical protein [Sphingobacteriia bacterium]
MGHTPKLLNPYNKFIISVKADNQLSIEQFYSASNSLERSVHLSFEEIPYIIQICAYSLIANKFKNKELSTTIMLPDQDYQIYIPWIFQFTSQEAKNLFLEKFFKPDLKINFTPLPKYEWLRLRYFIGPLTYVGLLVHTFICSYKKNFATTVFWGLMSTLGLFISLFTSSFSLEKDLAQNSKIYIENLLEELGFNENESYKFANKIIKEAGKRFLQAESIHLSYQDTEIFNFRLTAEPTLEPPYIPSSLRR